MVVELMLFCGVFVAAVGVDCGGDGDSVGGIVMLQVVSIFCGGWWRY